MKYSALECDRPEMRKADLLILACVIAAGSYHWQHQLPQPPKLASSPIPATVGLQDDFVTDSGQWRVLPVAYQLAGLSPGMSVQQIRKLCGPPTKVIDPQAQTQIWEYKTPIASDEHQPQRELMLTILDGRLIFINATGYSLTKEGPQGGPVCQTGSSLQLLEKTWGEPASRSDSCWTYRQSPAEIVFEYTGQTVTMIRLSSQVQSRPLSSITPRPYKD